MKQKIFILLCTIGICISVHAKKYIVHSPDNKIKVSITADKQLIWSIGTTVPARPEACRSHSILYA